MYILTVPSTKTEYGVVTGSNRVTAIFDDPIRAEQHRSQMDPNWKVVTITTSVSDTEMSVEQIDHCIDNVWSLTAYLRWLNRNDGQHPTLVEDLDHWKDYGITTARGLADYLDACVAREVEKSRRYELAVA